MITENSTSITSPKQSSMQRWAIHPSLCIGLFWSRRKLLRTHIHTHNSRAGHVHATLRLETSITQSRCVLWHIVYFFCCKCVGYACTIKLIKPIMTHTDHDHVEDLNQTVSARVYSSADPRI